MNTSHAEWVRRNVLTGYYSRGANRRNQLCDPIGQKPACPCQWVCDDCDSGRHAHCAEVRDPRGADWRRLPRPDTGLRMPGRRPAGSLVFIDVWITGFACRYVCACECGWQTRVPRVKQTAVQAGLF